MNTGVTLVSFSIDMRVRIPDSRLAQSKRLVQFQSPPPQTEKPACAGCSVAFTNMLDLWRGVVHIPWCRVKDGKYPLVNPHPSQDRAVQAKTLPLAVDSGLSPKDVDRGPKFCNHRKPFPEIVFRTRNGAGKPAKTNIKYIYWPKATPTICQPDRLLGLHGGAIAEFGSKQITYTEESNR